MEKACSFTVEMSSYPTCLMELRAVVHPHCRDQALHHGHPTAGPEGGAAGRKPGEGGGEGERHGAAGGLGQLGGWVLYSCRLLPASLNCLAQPKTLCMQALKLARAPPRRSPAAVRSAHCRPTLLPTSPPGWCSPRGRERPARCMPWARGRRPRCTSSGTPWRLPRRRPSRHLSAPRVSASGQGISYYFQLPPAEALHPPVCSLQPGWPGWLAGCGHADELKQVPEQWQEAVSIKTPEEAAVVAGDVCSVRQCEELCVFHLSAIPLGCCCCCRLHPERHPDRADAAPCQGGG